MSLSSQSYDLERLPENPEASQPLDLKKSLRIRDGLELSRPKTFEVHILPSIWADFDGFPGICFN